VTYVFWGDGYNERLVVMEVDESASVGDVIAKASMRKGWRNLPLELFIVTSDRLHARIVDETRTVTELVGYDIRAQVYKSLSCAIALLKEDRDGNIRVQGYRGRTRMNGQMKVSPTGTVVLCEVSSPTVTYGRLWSLAQAVCDSDFRPRTLIAVGAQGTDGNPLGDLDFKVRNDPGVDYFFAVVSRV
jgi:hypothetical protein